MRKNILSFFLILSYIISFGQSDEKKVYKISSAVAYAKSPALSELTLKVSPNQNLSNDTVKEVKNKFNIEEWKTVDNDKASAKVQTKMGTRKSRGPIAGFGGQGMTGVYPPDTDGDVSHDHFIQVVNSKYNVYSKEGEKLLGPLDLSTLWDNLEGPWNGTNDGDPIILYDEIANRWLITQFSVFTPIKYELFALSETADPLGAYHLYAFEFEIMNDYPKIGVWPDGYYATYNMHNNGFQGGRITVVEREKMLNGDPDAQMIEFHRSSQASLMPADIDGTNFPENGAPCPIMDIDASSLQVKFYNFHTDWENPENSSLNLAHVFNVTPFNYLENTNDGVGGFVTQPGTSQKLDGLGNMIMNRLSYRKFDDHETMVVTHSIKVNSGSGVMRAAPRWYEFRKEDDDWELYQEGTYSPDNNHRWMGSCAINANGDIALAYSVSNSEDIYPSIRYTGRRAGDPLGEMTIEEIELKKGSTNQNHWRWGDYACLNIDPTDGSTFWFTTEYDGWKTWISSFNLGEISAPICNAGEDAIICSNSQFETEGSGVSVMDMLWTSTGDGFFSPSNQFNSTYIRGNQDVENGGCLLILNTIGYDSIQTDSDTMFLNIVDEPECNAGEDADIFQDQSYTLQASAIFPGNIVWTSDGDGSFSNPTELNPIYTPGPNDIMNGGVNLHLYIEAIEPCTGSAEDEMHLGILTGTRNINTSSNTLKVFPNPSNGIFNFELSNTNAGKTIRFYLYDNHGNEIFTQKSFVNSSVFKRQISLANFVNGIYFLKIEYNNEHITKKLIKK